MKKLKRLNLPDSQMKMVVGGYAGYSGNGCNTQSGSCEGSCYIGDTMIKGKCTLKKLNGSVLCACEA